MAKFLKDKEKLKFVLAPHKHSEKDADIVYECTNCGTPVFEVHDKIGVGKLPRDQVKLKCCGCGMYFITNRDRIEKVLGGV